MPTSEPHPFDTFRLCETVEEAHVVRLVTDGLTGVFQKTIAYQYQTARH